MSMGKAKLVALDLKSRYQHHQDLNILYRRFEHFVTEI